MVIQHVITHGLAYAGLAIGYLLLVMITVSPRVWGYADYSAAIKAKISRQARGEKALAVILGAPWLVFVLGFPIYSTYALKSELGNEIPFWIAFLNPFVLTLFVTAGDLVVLDWLVVSKITPGFVMIPGTTKEDYRDFSHHFRAHAKMAIVQIVLCLVIAAVVSRSPL